MRIWDLILTGLQEIRAHKMRSFLSFFAVAIGIATFFYTLSILSQRYKEIDQAGVLAGGEGGLSFTIENGPIVSLTDYEAFSHALPEGASLSLQSYFVPDIYYRGMELSPVRVVGVAPAWKEADFVYRLEGRFINWQDVLTHQRVAVLTIFPRHKKSTSSYNRTRNGRRVQTESMEEFTTHHNLLNQQIKIEEHSFTIVGLLYLPDTDLRFSDAVRDDLRTPRLLIPFTSFNEILYSWWESVTTDWRILTPNFTTAKAAAKKTVSFLRSQWGIEDKYEIAFTKEKIEKENEKARKELSRMFFLGLIAMIAGGIGIMNVTMAVIFSRTKEIGVRRALGATKMDILKQFLIEAMLLGLCGAMAGMVLGYLAVLHLAEDTRHMTFAWWVVLLSVLIALITSFLFALYPAYQAAKLRPIDALKYE